MHSGGIANAHSGAAWRDFTAQGPGRMSCMPDSGRHCRGGDRPEAGPRTQGSDYARQVMYSRVVSMLTAEYGSVRSLPMQGMTSAESATQDLAGAVRQALVRGGEGEGALRKAVDNGLAGAVSQLQALGMEESNIAGIADELRSRLESFIDAARSAQGGEVVVAAGASYLQKQKTEIEIVTQEGDTVRLNMRSRLSVAAGGVAASAADGKASSAAVSVIAGNKFEISVEGHLNDEEVAAIRDVLIKVEVLADDFFAGDVQAAFDAATTLEIDGDQLASVALELTLKQRLRASGFVSLPVAPVPAQPAQSTMPTGQPVEATAPVAEDPASLLPDASATAPVTEEPATEGANPVPEDTVEPGSVITGYLMQLLDSLRDAGSQGEASMSWRFRLELLQAVVSVRTEENPDASQPAAHKLGNCLRAMS